MKVWLSLVVLAIPWPLAAEEDIRFWRVDDHITRTLDESPFSWEVRYQENSRMIHCTSCEENGYISIALMPIPENAQTIDAILDSYEYGRRERCLELAGIAGAGCVFTKETSHRYMPGFHALTRLSHQRAAYERMMVSGGLILVYGEGPNDAGYINEMQRIGTTMTRAINQLY